jgi:DNA repair protein RadC
MKTSFGEFKITTLRETATPYTADTPEAVTRYIRENVTTSPSWNPDVEQMVVLLMNTRCKIVGHSVIGVGTVDQVLVDVRGVFRPALIANAKSVVLCHNHPSGDPTPSEADIRITRDLIRAGRTLQTQLMDHIILGEDREGARGYVSLRELGHFSI